MSNEQKEYDGIIFDLIYVLKQTTKSFFVKEYIKTIEAKLNKIIRERGQL